MFNILGIGELLWDMLPAGPQLGGAPANFTVMAGRLGNHATILSRIGDDAPGREALAVLQPFPVDCSALQVDPAHSTGSVTVTLADGQPSYTIHQPVAWDFLEATQAWREAATTADAICFGSLAQRSPVSRQAILELLEGTRQGCQRIFDVNLRAPFYSAEIVRPSLQLATVLKMNDAEVPLLLEMLCLPAAASLRHAADCILSEFASLNLIAITRGGQGSLLVSREDYCDHPGIPTQIADTVGAGDAFTAAMTHYLLRVASLATLSEAGNHWGSYVASQSGAMPPISEETLRRMEREIES